jgi:hypothetical protein
MEDDLINRIERAFAAAVKAHAAPIRLEVTRAQYDELCRQYGTQEGIRLYRGKPVVIASRISLGNRVAQPDLGDPRTDCWDTLRVLPSAANRRPGELIPDHFAGEIAAIHVGRERVLS